MKAALRQPALQVIAGIAAFLLLTWPLLAFDRPLSVVAAFFGFWSLIIAVLFAFSRAPEEDAAGADGRTSEAPDA